MPIMRRNVWGNLRSRTSFSRGTERLPGGLGSHPRPLDGANSVTLVAARNHFWGTSEDQPVLWRTSSVRISQIFLHWGLSLCDVTSRCSRSRPVCLPVVVLCDLAQKVETRPSGSVQLVPLIACSAFQFGTCHHYLHLTLGQLDHTLTIAVLVNDALLFPYKWIMTDDKPFRTSCCDGELDQSPPCPAVFWIWDRSWKFKYFQFLFLISHDWNSHIWARACVLRTSWRDSSVSCGGLTAGAGCDSARYTEVRESSVHTVVMQWREEWKWKKHPRQSFLSESWSSTCSRKSHWVTLKQQ